MLKIPSYQAGVKTKLHIMSCYNLLPKLLNLAKLHVLSHFTSVISGVIFCNSASPPLLNLSPKLTVWPIDRGDEGRGEKRKRKQVFSALSFLVKILSFVFSVRSKVAIASTVLQIIQNSSQPQFIHSWMSSERRWTLQYCWQKVKEPKHWGVEERDKGNSGNFSTVPQILMFPHPITLLALFWGSYENTLWRKN